MGLLDGKVAAITGAGGGIGRSHALLFASEGARVVVNDVGGSLDGSGHGSDMANSVVDEITRAGGQACANHGDVSDPDGAQSIVTDAVEKFGGLDILVNNAGILRDKSLRKMTVEMFDDVIRVHLRGTFLCLQAAARHMSEHGQGGRIINTSSVSGLIGMFGQANYSAAKAGIFGLTRTASIELARYKITVNALAPVAHTRMTEELPMMKAMPAASEMLSPELVAPAALFLASELSSHVTGQVLAVEGKRMYVYKMTQTDALTPETDAWTAEEIAQRWGELSN
jgi:NAD(P)-dependent dehydrogenase (short-subunit alcohol dehydrogenase family)